MAWSLPPLEKSSTLEMDAIDEEQSKGEGEYFARLGVS